MRIVDFIGNFMLFLFVFNSLWILSGITIWPCTISTQYGGDFIACGSGRIGAGLTILLNLMSHNLFVLAFAFTANNESGPITVLLWIIVFLIIMLPLRAFIGLLRKFLDRSQNAAN